MVRVFLFPRPESDLGVTVVPWSFLHYGSHIGFARRGAIASICQAVDNDVDLFLDWSFWAGRGTPISVVIVIGKHPLVSDVPMKVYCRIRSWICLVLIGLGGLRSPLSWIWRKTSVRVELRGIGGDLSGDSSGLSILLLWGPEGSSQGYSIRGHFWSSHFLATSVSVATYWFARYSISDTVVGGRSINYQKNLEGWSPIRNTWITIEGWASGIPRISAIKRPTNWVRGLSLPWVRPRSDAVVGLGRELARKLSSNSLASESKEGIDYGLSRLYHIWGMPLRVLGSTSQESPSQVGNSASTWVGVRRQGPAWRSRRARRQRRRCRRDAHQMVDVYVRDTGGKVDAVNSLALSIGHLGFLPEKVGQDIAKETAK
ncbi:hypothetical protein B296_00004633 [Ensete ventricosum]|uniref:Uncharacterized protein n=1 Tax=Ensete ventricosum TaxID=4639 RepID=A0A427B0Q5_ENSVE|nr:hypothetical protein B296_00004633 [Ensete ventricosum]